jgi:hypothetical protein
MCPFNRSEDGVRAGCRLVFVLRKFAWATYCCSCNAVAIISGHEVHTAAETVTSHRDNLGVVACSREVPDEDRPIFANTRQPFAGMIESN